MTEKIKVDIYKDVSASTRIDTDIAYRGLEKISETINSDHFEVVNDSHHMRIGKDESQIVNFNKVNWREPKQNFSIILTDKQVITNANNGANVFGVAQRFPINGALKGTALVNVTATDPELVVAHEVSHLLGLKYDANTTTPERHCSQLDCLMSKEMRTEMMMERVAKKGLKGFLERHGYLTAEYQAVEQVITKDFCPPCIEKLARQAFFAHKSANGEMVLPGWF